MKQLLWIGLSMLSLTVTAQSEQVTVKASIKGTEPGKWVYFREQGGGNKKDSVKTVAGGFTYTLDIPSGEGNMFFINMGKGFEDPNAYTMVYLDKGVVNIAGEGPGFKEARITGSAGLMDYQAFEKFIKTAPELSTADSVFSKANELYRNKDTVALNALQTVITQLRTTRTGLMKKWISEHPQSAASTVVLSQIRFDLGEGELETIFNTLDATATDNAPGKNIARSIAVAKLTGIGQTAIDFTQNDTLGKPVSLKDFRGKYVLLDFWASWCRPCRAENPNVVAMYQKYKDKNFTVLGVSLDQPNAKEKWLEAIHKDRLTWTHVSDLKFWDNAVAKQYDVQGIPANFLIGPDGKIIARDLHGDELGNKLAELLK